MVYLILEILWFLVAAAAIGFAVGAFLGAHLLVTASLTFGYGVSVVSLAGYATAVAYDAGANTLIAKPVTFLALVKLMKVFTAYWLDAATLPPEPQTS